ncbi:MAG: exopolyphosphatase, partial [Firmicutes bacterium]|nr:exopolyphosphatase [Bacillota bacterium]
MYCVIDIGSNTIRLVIYTLENGQLNQALSSKATAGLAGFVEDGAMSEEGIERLLGVLHRFHGVLSLLPDCQVYPFATASLRGLKNTADIVARVERETGFKVDVITGREEAILDYRGAVGRMQERSGVLVDIGGGSTELVFFRSREV